MRLKALLANRLGHNIRTRNIFFQRTYASSSPESKDEFDLDSIDLYPKFREELTTDETEEVEQRKNKSNLTPHDYNREHGRRPYEEFGIARHHYTLDWKRKMFGRYGLEGSTIPAGVAWPTAEEINLAKEYEKFVYPLSLKEGLARIAEINEERETALRKRDADIAVKVMKTVQWEKDLRAKLAKKEAEIREARERKERMVEEVRRHFGFKVDPRDEKFKEMLAQKEKEDKKLRKAAKQKERSDKIMARLLAGESIEGLSKITQSTTTPSEVPKTDEKQTQQEKK